MTEYALVGPADEIKTFSSSVDPNVQTKPGWRWLPVERSTVGAGPVADPAVTTVLADRVTVVITLRDKTASEIDAEKEGRLDAYDVLTFKVLFDHENRVRALEGKAAISAAQFRAALKARL